MNKEAKSIKIVRELKRIADQNGGIILPELVVERARPASSPLHGRFEWDNTKAAHAHRLWQARQLISVCVEQIEGVSEPTNVFVSLRSDRNNEGGYRVMTEVLSRAELKAQMLNDALKELQSFQRKYASLKELASVFDSIRRVRKKAA